MHNSKSLKLVTAPVEEPITIEEARWELRDAPEEDDPFIRSLIIAARKHVETILKRQCCTATWDYRLDCFPASQFELPLPPLQSVTSITYLEPGGVATVWPVESYLVDTYAEPGRITPAYNAYWPPIRYQQNAVTVRFVAGYGEAFQVPEPIKQAIRMHVRMTYEGCPETEFASAIRGILSSEYWGCYV